MTAAAQPAADARAAAPAARASRGGHLGYVDGARGIAAVYVALHHSWQIVWSETPHPLPFLWSLLDWLAYGGFAVSAFIAISGFSLMLPVARGDGRLPGGAWTFFKRRARRILPPYYFAILFSLAMIWLWLGHPSGTSWDASIPISKGTLIIHLLLLHDLWPNGFYLINGVFWSIALEWHLYFLFPPLVALARRFGTAAICLATALAGVVLYGVLFNLPTHDLGKLAYLPARLMTFVDYMGLFALGMLAATVAFSKRPVWLAVRSRVPWGPLGLAAFTALAILLGAHGPLHITKQVTLGADLLTAFSTLAFFIAAATRGERSLARAILGAKPIAFMGKFAYSIYLIHAPIVAAVYLCIVRPHISGPLHLPFPATVAILLVLATPLSLVVAYLFFLVCERPFLNKPLGGQPAKAEATAAVSPLGVAGRTVALRRRLGKLFA